MNDSGDVAALVLDVPDEPLELRARTRALVEQAPVEGSAVIDAGEWIARPLWEAWADQLQRAGIGWPQFLTIVVDYRRELWLWVMGERTWAQCAAGLVGRAARRQGAAFVSGRGGDPEA